MRNKKGFTLIELLAAIAIIGILAAVVLVSYKGYADNAKASKVHSMLASTIPSMASCWSMSGKVYQPVDGIDICSLSSTYGQWPALSSDGTDFFYDPEYIYGNNCPLCSTLGYSPPVNNNDDIAHTGHWTDFFIRPALGEMATPTNCVNETDWYFSARNWENPQKVCCNKQMSGCKLIDSSATCSSSTN